MMCLKENCEPKQVKKRGEGSKGGGKGVLGGLGGSEVLSQKENPYGEGPKVGWGGLKC